MSRPGLLSGWGSGNGENRFYPGVCRRAWNSGAGKQPTFTIVQQYEEGRMPLYHFDVYRIGDVSEMDEIGYEDCFYGEGVCLIEWSQLIPEILPEHVIRIRIEKDLSQGFDYRKITVEGLEK